MFSKSTSLIKKLGFVFFFIFSLYVFLMSLVLYWFSGENPQKFFSSTFPEFFLASAVLTIPAYWLWNSIARSLFIRRITRLKKLADKFAKGKVNLEDAFCEDEGFYILEKSMNKIAVKLHKQMSEFEHERIKLASILNNTMEGVIAVNDSGQVMVINLRAEAILELPKGISLQKTLLEVVRNQDIESLVRGAIRRQETVQKEIQLTHIGGKIIKCSAIGMGTSSSQIAGLLLLYDMSEIKRLENVRRDFVANVSHELKTPLTSIKGFIETLLNGALDDKEQSKRFLEMMQEDSDRLARLIQDLLELSRLETHQIPLNLSLTHPKKILESVIRRFQPQIEAKKIRIENRVPGDEAFAFKVDYDHFVQIFDNLLSNAIKFSPDGSQVTLDADLLEGSIEFVVRDEGDGISEKDQKRVFERFYRVDKARSRQLGGTGLGLAFVKLWAENHGGAVRLESTPGGGSAFFVRFPRG